METSRLIRVYMVLAVLALLGLGVTAFLVRGGTPKVAEREVHTSNPLGNPPGMVDRLERVDTAEGFARGKMEGVDLLTGSDGIAKIMLKDEGETKDYPKKGTWTGAEVKTAFAFTELIPSWNVKTPGETGVYFEVRTKDAASGEWSPWMYIGYWGRVLPEKKKVDRFDHGIVHMDNLVLDRPADAYQMRATLQTFEAIGSSTPTVRRVSVVYSGVVKDDAERERLAWKPEIKGTWAVDLPVPYRPQGDSTKALSSQICSPTSTSMVMEYMGVNRPTVENAEAIYDRDWGIFGNWGRAVSRAGEMGFDSWVTRFRNWDQVKATIASGQPIICSIKAKKGDFQGPHIYEETGGHLIVLRGLTADGNAIVNDPARRAKGNGFVYDQADMERVWIGHGGVGYIIRKPAQTTEPTTRVAAGG